MVDVITENLDLWSAAMRNKSTAGRGTSDKQTAYGIKKLRELILELAVRGKLVPQDPNDESASVLLEKIAVEKERLIKEGKIKKQNPLPEINDEEKPFDLPENWKWTKLGNISFINPRNEADDNSIASFVPMSLITTSHTGEHEQEFREWKEIKNGYTHFANGDIGVAKITPCFENSKAVVFTSLSSGIGAGTTELHVARPYGDTLCARYILIYLKSPEFLIVGESKMTGTAGQKRIPKEFFAENPLPLPPLAEQHRIVAKVDELMALCDQLEQQQTDNIAAHQTLVQTLLDTLIAWDGVYAGNAGAISGDQATDAAEFEQAWSRIADHFDTLFTTESSIDQLKQTLLQLAVMGKLVPQDPNDEPARTLLDKIYLQKTRLIDEGKLKPQKGLPEISEEEIPPHLPTGWDLVRLGEIINVLNGRAYKKHEMLQEGTPLLRVGNLFTSNEWYYSDLELEPDKYIDNGDLIYAWSASFGPFIWQGGKAIYHYHIWKLDLYDPSCLDKQFLFYFFTSITEKIKASGNGIAMIHMTKERMEKLILEIPPLAEQHRIVAKVNELMVLCDTLKARIAAARTTQLQLADAIVEQAVA